MVKDMKGLSVTRGPQHLSPVLAPANNPVDGGDPLGLLSNYSLSLSFI